MQIQGNVIHVENYSTTINRIIVIETTVSYTLNSIIFKGLPFCVEVVSGELNFFSRGRHESRIPYNNGKVEKDKKIAYDVIKDYYLSNKVSYNICVTITFYLEGGLKFKEELNFSQESEFNEIPDIVEKKRTEIQKEYTEKLFS